MIIKKFGRIYEDEDGQLQIKDFDIAVGNASEVTQENIVKAITSYLLHKTKIHEGDTFNFFTERTVMMAMQKAAGKEV